MLAVVLTLASGLLLVLAGPAPRASALEGPNTFTSAALPTAQTNGTVWASASARGLVFVGGSFTSVRPSGAVAGSNESARSGFAVLDGATGQATSCAPAFTFPSNPAMATVRALDVSPDGQTLYIGGYFSHAGGQPHRNVAALDIASCTIRSDFGASTNSTVRALESTAAAVFVGGDLNQVNGVARTFAGAVNAVGAASPGAVRPWAPVLDKTVYAIGLKPSGGPVVLGGAFSSVNGADSVSLAAVDPATAVTVRAYAAGFFPSDRTVVRGIAVDDTGFYLASEGTGPGKFDGRMALDWATLDKRWVNDCAGATQGVVSYGGLLYSASHAHDCKAMGWFPDGERHHLLAEATGGGQIQPWFPNTNGGTGEALGPRSLVVARSGTADYLWVVGEFTTVNGQAQQGLTRFGQGVDTAGPSAPTTSATSLRPGQVRVAWRASDDTDDATLTYRVYRDGGTTPVRTVTAASWFWSRPQLEWVDTGLAKGSTHTYRVTASDGTTTTSSATVTVKVSSSGSTYAETVLADGATQLWRYDDMSGAFVPDSAGGGRSGVLTGSATFQHTPAAIPHDPSKALLLTGKETRVVSALRSPGPTTWTQETWFKTTTTTGGVMLGFGERPTMKSYHGDRQLFMSDDGRVSFGISLEGQPSTVIASPKSYNDGVWHHVAATHDESGMTLYLDGARVRHSPETRVRPQAGYWRVGHDEMANWPNRSTSLNFSGALDETAIYPTALTPRQILNHYALGGGRTTPGPPDFYGRTIYQDDPDLAWRLGESCCPWAEDATGKDNRGYYHGGVAYGTAGAVSGTSDTAVTFNTNQTYVSSELPAQPPAEFTEELWVYPNAGATGLLMGIGDSFGISTNTDRVVYFDLLGRLVFGIRTGATRTTVTSGRGLAPNAWHHVLASKGPAGMQLWVDGLLVASKAVPDALQTSPGYWHIGGDSLAGWPLAPAYNFFGGRLDEFAVYPVQLGPQSVAAHYSAGRWSVADAAPPTVPAPVAVAVVGNDVRVSWPSSLDNVGVTTYEVFRSASPGFTPGPATRIATVSSPSYVDAGAPPGRSFYVVVAVDAGGNRSAPSHLATAYRLT